MRTDEPRAIALKDYRAPDYRISEIALDFLLDPDATRVTATMNVVRTGAAAPLVLNGEQLKLVSVALDGRALSPADYTVDDETLTIAKVPAKFTLEIVTEIAPADNTALEGLYMSNGIFCTQCEAGRLSPHHLFPRPAGQSRRLHHAHRGRQGEISDPAFQRQSDRSGRSCRRPAFRRLARSVPEALLSLRAGGGRSGRARRRVHPTMSGRKVDLRIYVEHGNEAARITRWIRSSAPCAGTRKPTAANTISTSS